MVNRIITCILGLNLIWRISYYSGEFHIEIISIKFLVEFFLEIIVFVSIFSLELRDEIVDIYDIGPSSAISCECPTGDALSHRTLTEDIDMVGEYFVPEVFGYQVFWFFLFFELSRIDIIRGEERIES